MKRWMLTGLTAMGVALAPLPVLGAPRVHVLNELPDDDRGVVKLARYLGTTTQAAPNAVVFTTHYDEVCSLPCGEAIDISERPIFFLVRDGQAVSYGFRLPDTEEVTLSVKPVRRGMAGAGVMLSGLFLLPIGVPLMMMGRARVSIAAGPPTDDQRFKKLRRART